MICTVIVSYYPDEGLLKGIGAALVSSQKVVIVDNGSIGCDQIFSKLRSNPQVHLIMNQDNLGIAAALNQGIRWGLDQGYDWFLTLDQDSEVHSDMVEKMIKAFEAAPDREEIGILAPVHYDKTTGYQSKYLEKLKGPYTHTDIVMTSGNLIPRKTFEKVGFYDEELFIEYVDHDYCLKVKKTGLKIVLVSDAKMAHQLGNIRMHRWFGAMYFFSHNYAPVRRYYRARNRFTLYLRHPSLGWILKDQDFFIRDFFKILTVEKEKWAKVKATVLGTLDAFIGKEGPYDGGSLRQRLASIFLKKESVLKYSMANLLGQALPLLIGLVTIPKIIHGLGVEKFGLLSIIWVFLGYFSLFDFGLSRAITLFTSEALARGEKEKIGPHFWTSFVGISGLSLIGSLILLSLSEQSVMSVLSVTESFRSEGHRSILLVAFGIPLVTMTTAFKGLLESSNRFTELNLLQAGLGAYNFLVPLLTLHYSNSLVPVVLSLIFGRFIALLLHAGIAFKYFSEIRRFHILKLAQFKEALRFGGWLTVSNLISPIMVYFDRFALGAMVPTNLVAYYTAPFEMVSRLLIIPSSLTRAIFPSLTYQKVSGGADRQLYGRSVGIIFVAMGLICTTVFWGSTWGLQVWLGHEFAQKSSVILKILVVGIFANSMAWVPYTFLQAHGRSDLTAKVHLVELPFYLVTLISSIYLMGINGVAWAWTLRVIIDALLLYILAQRLGAGTKTAQ